MASPAPLIQTRQNVLRGIGFMLLGMFLFALNDTLGKQLIGIYTLGQLTLIRGVAGLAIMLPLLWRTGLPPLDTSYRPRLQLLRFVLSPAEACLFFYALISLPLAEVITYYQAGPIWVTALSALLGERVGWRRWTAVFAGFCGVLIALHPTTGLSAGALAALLGSVLYAGFLVVTGRLPGLHRSVLMVQQLCATLLMGAGLVLLQGWVAPGPVDAGLMLVLGLGSLAGNLCVNLALRLGPAITIVPFQYTMLFWGILLGFLVFGDVPGIAGLAGAGIIVGAGLYIMIREHRLAQARALPVPQ